MEQMGQTVSTLLLVFVIVAGVGAMIYITRLVRVCSFKKSDIEFIEKFAKRMNIVEDRLIIEGVKREYEEMETGNLIVIYKNLKQLHPDPDSIEAFENTCRLSFIDKIMEQRNVAKWTYDPNSKSKDELVVELIHEMDKAKR